MTPEQIMALAFQDELEKIAGLPARLRGMSALEAVLNPALPNSVATRIALKEGGKSARLGPSLSTRALRRKAGRNTSPGEVIESGEKLPRDPKDLGGHSRVRNNTRVDVDAGGAVGQETHLANLRRYSGVPEHLRDNPSDTNYWRLLRARAMGASDKVQAAYRRRAGY